MPDDAVARAIRDKAVLREVMGEPAPAVREKEMPRLDAHCRRFIEMSPILFISSTGADGKGDVTPRGDPPGFVKVLDDRALLIPERLGNKRADTMMNVLTNPNVGIVFLIPGVDETLRVNGRATVIEDAALLAPLAVNGRAPRLGLRIDIDDVFIHCGRALKRARLWDPASRIERKSFPSMAQMTHDQRRRDATVAELETFFDDFYKTLY
jgi:PPOX class probable FMN-dependent enzyme